MEASAYEKYTTEAFLNDPLFIEWIKNNSIVANKFWLEWIKSQPVNLPAMREAEKQLRYIFSLQRIEPDKTVVEEVWNKITQRIEPAQTKIFHLKSAWVKWMAAASLITVALAYYFFKYTDDQLIKISSAYGTIKQLTLSDSSVVILNGNSSISFKKRWKANQPRELWLDGEGFFDVRHLDNDNRITQHERFLVHVKNVVVEVLGTSFDIRSRRNRLEVVLQSGSIKVSFSNKSRGDIILKPAEMVSFDPVHPETVNRSTTEAQSYSTWTQRKLILKNAPLQEIIQYMEDNYGKKIILGDTSLRNRKIQGTILLDNLDDAMFVLSKVLNININIKSDSTILFMPK